jgi:hypothetical protein
MNFFPRTLRVVFAMTAKFHFGTVFSWQSWYSEQRRLDFSIPCEIPMSKPELTSLNWAIEYELPNLNLVLTFMMATETEEEALAEFRKRHPHGKITKINGQPVKDDGIVITER